METSEHPEVLFPSEDEVKSYFPDDVWNAMSQYERNSYRNIFHNYNVMRSLDLKPEKPAFMTLYQKKVSKRKAAKSPCRRPIPAKKPRLKKETPVKKIKVQQQKKKSETFSSCYKWSCIKAHCVFSAVFKVYKRFYGSIKGHYLNKRKPVKVANKHLINKASVENCDKTLKNEIITKNGQSENGSSSKISEGCNDEKRLQALMDSQVKNDNKLRSVEIENMKVLSEKSTTVSVQDTALKNTEENISSTSFKKEESLNPVNKTPPVTAAVPHTKPVCRSVQTMTVAEGCSPSNCGALVFVNAATSKKSAVPFPDPKPLTPQQRKRMEKINREKMKNRRSIMTQTAAENTSIEEAKLVSIFVPKNPKKKSTPATKSDLGEKKEEVPTNTDNHENKVFATISDSDTTAAVSSLASSGSDEQQQTKTVATVTKPEVKDSQDDDSSDDEFGFYALARQLEYERAKKASSVADIKTGLGDSDLAVPGCSGLQSDLVFPCNKCHVTYTSPLYLEAHGKRCRGEKQALVKVDPSSVPTDVQTLAVVVDGKKMYCCNLCNYKTVISSHFKNHLLTHSGERPYVCDVCDKRFTQARSLDTHKRIHTGDKPYKCSDCSYTCNRSDNLSRHIARCHTGEKAFACMECDYKTTTSGNMERHSRTHSGVKPYSCPLCSYRTAHISSLTAHMKTHTGDKPHHCPHCQYSAAWKGNLNKHISKHHPTQL